MIYLEVVPWRKRLFWWQHKYYRALPVWVRADLVRVIIPTFGHCADDEEPGTWSCRVLVGDRWYYCDQSLDDILEQIERG